jgi:hypothetical protein
MITVSRGEILAWISLVILVMLPGGPFRYDDAPARRVLTTHTLGITPRLTRPHRQGPLLVTAAGPGTGPRLRSLQVEEATATAAAATGSAVPDEAVPEAWAEWTEVEVEAGEGWADKAQQGPDYSEPIDYEGPRKLDWPYCSWHVSGPKRRSRGWQVTGTDGGGVRWGLTARA